MLKTQTYGNRTRLSNNFFTFKNNPYSLLVFIKRCFQCLKKKL